MIGARLFVQRRRSHDDYRDTLVRRARGRPSASTRCRKGDRLSRPKRALREMLDGDGARQANLEVADLRVELGKAKTTAAERFESIREARG